jgi:hypothetical protein
MKHQNNTIHLCAILYLDTAPFGVTHNFRLHMPFVHRRWQRASTEGGNEEAKPSTEGGMTIGSIRNRRYNPYPRVEFGATPPVRVEIFKRPDPQKHRKQEIQ